MTFQALLFCPDEKTSRVTTQILNELEFTVEPATEPFAAVKKLMGQHFDAIVVDCDNEQNAGLILKSARNSNSNQSSLAVAVVEGQAGVANAFRLGANLVLTKPVNVEQAKSTLRVARGLLRKGADSTRSFPAMPSTASAPSTQSLPNPARSAISSSGMARGVVPAPSATKPAPVPFQAKAALTARKSPIDSGDVLATGKEPALAPQVGETVLFASTGKSTPSGAAQLPADKPKTGEPAAKKAWQPVSKPSEATPLSLEHADETITKSGPDPSPTVTRKPTAAASLNMAKPLSLLTSSAAGPSGAATAPARTMGTLKQKGKISDDHPSAALAEGIAESPSRAPAMGASFGVTPASPAEPRLAGLHPKPSDSTSRRSGKMGILVAVAVLVLAAAGYFAYIKLYAPGQAAGKLAAPSEPHTSDPATPSSPGIAPTSDAAGATATAQQGQVQIESTSPAAKSAPPAPEVVVKSVPGSKSIVVKPGATAQKGHAGANAEVAAPPVLGSAAVSEPSVLSHIVSTPPVAAPKMAVQTLKVSQGVTQGLLIKRVQPIYPRQAMQMHIQGIVQLQATISKEGVIRDTKITSGDPGLARAAVEAVKQWRYKPYFLNGEPVEIETQITINFKLP